MEGKWSKWKSENGVSTPISTQKGRKNIKDIKELEDLSLETRVANNNEKERLKRIEEKEQKFLEELGNQENENHLILDYDFEKKVPLVTVHPVLVQKLKKHQKDGVKFMWNACYESLEQTKQSVGSGCILAHCMGLGKTLQVVTLVHTLLNHNEINTSTVLICCPKNTLLNWTNEFKKWITPEMGEIKIFNPTRFDNITNRLVEIKKWKSEGGVCVINYELMRILLENCGKNVEFTAKDKQKFQECLCDPGPDLIICDEGHLLKNEETKLSKVMSRIRTLRRVVLTGTPLQNNLKEYHCMIQFVKPHLLGSLSEFTNMFVNPILNGQYENSLVRDVQLMKQRSHVLHKQLLGCVQRFDLTTLKKYLLEKHEYVISIALTSSQMELYRFYVENYSSKRDLNGRGQSVKLFADHQCLQRIWTHPYTLKLHREKYKEIEKNKKKKRKRKKDVESDESDEYSDLEVGNWKYPLSWWAQFIFYGDMEDARKSGKLAVLLEILKKCEDASEKLLVFSSSLYSIRTIEHFLKKISVSEQDDPRLCNMSSTWEKELDYLILTGQTSSEDRDTYCKMFNNVRDTRLRLFIISTKAGGIGINLTAANRAILFDVSWNPSHDVQSIFRIYRIGQSKPCFIYRFVASGTMEEKIYERQVAKMSMSHRVIDEKQIARHYTEEELLELYTFSPNKEYTKNCNVKDPLLREVLTTKSDFINNIHEHDSLLEHKEEEELKEMEKNIAWTAYNDKTNNLNDVAAMEEEQWIDVSEDPCEPQIPRKPVDLKSKILELKNNFFQKKQNPINWVADKTNVKVSEVITIDSPDKGYNSGENPSPVVPSKKDSPDGADPFVCQIGSSEKKMKKRRMTLKPLKSWGARNGRPFGSPDKE